MTTPSIIITKDDEWDLIEKALERILSESSEEEKPKCRCGIEATYKCPKCGEMMCTNPYCHTEHNEERHSKLWMNRIIR